MIRVQTTLSKNGGSDNHFIIDGCNLVSIRVQFIPEIPKDIQDDINDAINELLCQFKDRVDKALEVEEEDD